jgi:IS30 family transposase
VPARRCRSLRVLSLAEREEISRGLAEGVSLRMVAVRLNRAPSTVSREVARHGGRHRYRAARADERAWDRARRPKPCKLAAVPRLCELVAAKLAQEWSPEQISGWLARTYPGEQALQVSTETIYRSLFVQARGVLRKELTAHLRTRRTMRRSRHATTRGQGRAGITDAISIRERPAEAADRAVPGHWEGDLLAGAANTHIATLVERQSRYVMLVKVDGKDTKTVVDALATHVQTLPVQLRASLTWDRGMELAEHKRFTVATNVAVYFCDPRSPWQRGTNENTNGLLRQYFPKQTDLSVFTQVDLDAVAARLNTRPRKTLQYQTPAARLAALVASTH